MPLLAPLARWFDAERRELPWRARDLDAPHPDPYAVLVSEFMLQQTQVATVLPYFEAWMRRVPDLESLAALDDDGLHKLWEGLGYYRRARNLQAAARALLRLGAWPREARELQALPGLGPYTAAALASMAFQRPEAALDGNAFRVLARLLALETDPREQAEPLRAWLRPALEALGPSRLTQAFMDLGARICVPRPRCGSCALAEVCAARQRGMADRIPPPRARTSQREVELLLLALESQGRWLLRRPGGAGLLAGLWQWPALPVEGQVPQAGLRIWKPWTQVYTHRKERVHPAALGLDQPFTAAPGLAWVEEEALAALPMGRRDQKLRALLATPGARQMEPASGLLEAFLSPLRAGGADPAP